MSSPVTRRPLVVGVLALVVLILGGVVLLRLPHSLPALQKGGQAGAFRTHKVSAKPTYYCPMHPTYTSDRPGDCPICNMRLVKRESEPTANSRQPTVVKNLKDICYMHNCPMVHAGKPCPMLVVAKEGERVTCPICGTHVAEAAQASKGKILYWTDPMIPGYKSDEPGTSPMGMDLVPVYEEMAIAPVGGAPTPEGYAPILVSPQKQQFIGIKTAAVERKALTKTMRTVGTIAHDPELYQAQAEYLQALKTLTQTQQSALAGVVEQATQLVESATIRLRHLGVSEDLIAEMATWQEPERSLLYTQPGEPVWVYAKVYEYELPLIRVGQPLTAEAPALPGQMFQGAVRAIDPLVDAMTRTIRIRAKLEDPHGQLKPEMFVNVTITIDLGEVLAIAQEAVFDTGIRQIVFVDKGQGLFEPRDVVVGMKAGGFYELKQGVVEGERVVTSGNFLIDSESRLKAALEGMGEEGHQHGQ